MEGFLTDLFDFQRFVRNKDVQKVINEVDSRYKKQPLDMRDLQTLNAAGDVYVKQRGPDEGEDG